MTIKDIANRLGISTSTVSRVLQNARDVSPATRQKVLDLIEKEKFHPNVVARNLKYRQTKTLGVVVPSFDKPFYSKVIGGIQEQAARLGFNILACQSRENHQTELAYIKTLLANKVDGLLVCMSRNTKSAQYLLELQKNNVPLVLFDRVGGLFNFSKVHVDNESGAQAMIRYLLEQGHRKIAHIGGPANLSVCIDRLKGYRKAHRDFGMPVWEELILEGDFSMESGSVCTEQLLRRGLKPDAVFCICDSMAIGCIKALLRHGYRIPGDIAVAGFDNDPITEHLEPALTTVEQPMQRIGEEAASLLIQKIHEPGSPNRDIMLETRLIIRESA